MADAAHGPPAAPTSTPRDRWLPVAYFAAGHLALLATLATLALRPGEFAGFFLGPRSAAAVHAITLGWLTTSILGALYMVWPVALGDAVHAGKGDVAACVLVVAGASGVVSHLWLDRYAGVGWSGLLVLAGAAWPALRFARRLPHARGPAAVRLHVGLALFNFALTAALGVMLAFDKYSPFLPARRTDAVFGHLHLGLVGWVGLMIFGIGYRLIPMFLPARPPQGASLAAGAILLEAGVLGLAAGFYFFRPLAVWGGVAIAAGIALFLFNVGRMLARRVPAPPVLRRPDLGMLHSLQALGYLGFALPLGLWLLISPDWHFAWIKVYGVFVLLGFPAQMVLGIAMRLFPMFAWREAWFASGFGRLPENPHRMARRPLQWITLAAWTAGLPLLAWGLGAREPSLIRWPALALLLGVVAAAANSAIVLRHLRRASRAAA